MGAVLMRCVAMTPITSLTDCDVAPMKRLLVNIDSFPQPFKKDAITCLHVRGEETSSRRLEVFQFNSSSSLKLKVMTITNRLDELFRSRVIVAPGDEEWWTVHQSCVCPVMRNVLRLRFKMSEIAVG